MDVKSELFGAFRWKSEEMLMNIVFLGTAAAEGVPAPFCDCNICRNARIKRGKEIRRRCSVSIDNKIVIDFGPDMLWSSVDFGLFYGQVSCILFSHSHFDHMSIQSLLLALPGYRKNKVSHRINIVGSESVYEYIYNNTVNIDDFWKIYRYEIIKPFDRIEYDEYTINAYPSNHTQGEQSLFYNVSDKKNMIFYGTDARPYSVKNVIKEINPNPFDMVISDCTYGTRKLVGSRHLNLEANIDIKNDMKNKGLLKENTKYILTHFSHDSLLPYYEMQTIAEENGMMIAYDGLEIVI